MNLKEAIAKIPEIMKSWPSGFNFKAKSKCIGLKSGDSIILFSDFDSEDWGVLFESRDKEFNKMIGEMYE